MEPAASVPVAGAAGAAAAAPAWSTTTQLPNPLRETKETRHLVPEAPPVHAMPAGSCTESCDEPRVRGAYAKGI